MKLKKYCRNGICFIGVVLVLFGPVITIFLLDEFNINIWNQILIKLINFV